MSSVPQNLKGDKKNKKKCRDEKDTCYLAEHKATEKPFDINPFKPRGSV